MNGVVLYGPQACGKTRNSHALMVHLGMSKVQDDYVPGQPVQDNTLHLTSMPCEGALDYSEVISQLQHPL